MAGIEVIRTRRLPEARLRARGFTGPLTQLPFALAALRADDFDIVHAFSTIDAQTGLLWRRLNGAPAIFTCVDPPDRRSLADHRLSLRFATQAYYASDAVTAAGEEVRRAISRWLALEVDAVDAGDAKAFLAIYRRCLDGAGLSTRRFTRGR